MIMILTAQAYGKTNIYQTAGIYHDQNHQEFSMQKFKNKTLLVVVGYSSCPKLCPMITAQLKSLEEWMDSHKVPTEKVQILFLTVDEKDTPDDLLKYSSKHHLNLKRWTLAQTSLEVKKKLTAQLGLSFNTDASVSSDHLRHSFSLAVVNSKGMIAKIYPNTLEIEIETVGKEIQAFL
ncbi:MAG: SCO family protein [Bdellovibrio sp.]